MLVLQTSLFANWVDTTALAILNGDLYTIEISGVLKRTNLSTGKVVPVGKADFANTRIMVAGSGSLFTIDPSGNLNRINPADGSWKQVGKVGDWAKSTAFAMLGDQLYTVASGGELYSTNPASGVWKQVGETDFVRTKYLVTAGDQIYSIEHDGDLREIDKATGSWKKIGESGDWLNTRLASSLNGKIYTIEGSPGNLFETDPKTGTWKQIGKKRDFRTKYLFPAGSSLYSIEFDGKMYRVDPVTGAQVAVG
jgi:tricorn protease-like protein